MASLTPGRCAVRVPRICISRISPVLPRMKTRKLLRLGRVFIFASPAIHQFKLFAISTYRLFFSLSQIRRTKYDLQQARDPLLPQPDCATA